MRERVPAFVIPDLMLLSNPNVSQAKAACETFAFVATCCGKSFGAVLTHLAQDSPSTALRAGKP